VHAQDCAAAGAERLLFLHKLGEPPGDPKHEIGYTRRDVTTGAAPAFELTGTFAPRSAPKAAATAQPATADPLPASWKPAVFAFFLFVILLTLSLVAYFRLADLPWLVDVLVIAGLLPTTFLFAFLAVAAFIPSAGKPKDVGGSATPQA